MLKEHLTAREREVAELMVLGHSAKSISDILYITLHTVKSHIHNIYSKYGLVDDIEKQNDPSKRVKFINIWNKEKYGDIDLIISKNQQILNENQALHNERIRLMNVILNAVKACNICQYSPNNKVCPDTDLKSALLQYSNFRGCNNGK